jgi:hypothetical protein
MEFHGSKCGRGCVACHFRRKEASFSQASPTPVDKHGPGQADADYLRQISLETWPNWTFQWKTNLKRGKKNIYQVRKIDLRKYLAPFLFFLLLSSHHNYYVSSKTICVFYYLFCLKGRKFWASGRWRHCRMLHPQCLWTSEGVTEPLA